MTSNSNSIMPRQSYSAHYLLEVIKTRTTDFWHTRFDNHGNFIIDNIQVSEKLVLENPNLPKGIIIGKNTQFEEFCIKEGEFESITIEGGEFNGPFLINDGVFKNNFKILGGTFNQGFQISGGQFQGSVFFQGGQFRKFFRIAGGSFKNSPHISGGIFHSEVKIEKGEFEGRFRIAGGEFKSDIVIWGGNFKFMFEISDGVFERYVSIVGGEFNHFNIVGGQFHKTLQVAGGEFSKSFKLQKGEFDCPININDGEFHFFQITSGIYNKNITIYGGKFNAFNISGGEFNHEFSIEGGEFVGDTYIEGGKFKRCFNIHGGMCSKTFMIVEETQIHELVLYNNSIGNLIINGAPVDEISFYNYVNSHSLKLMGVSSIKKEKGVKMSIYRSSLGNTEIIGCDWSNGILTVDDSKIIECYYTDTLFCKDIRSSETDPISNAKQIRDTYSQLKTMADKQNDRQSSLHFQAESNKQILRARKESLKRAFKFQKPYRYAKFRRNLWEWVQLELSKFSNDFGNSYYRAGWNILIFGTLFFCLYIPCVDPNLSFTWDVNQWWSGISYGFSNHFGDFLGFLNPARKYNYMSCTGSHCHPQWALVFDWISRVFLAFFLYGFIQAFRKYGKR